MSLFDSLIGGLARLIGLPPARDEHEPRRRAIPLPPSSMPAEPEPEPDPEPVAEAEPIAKPEPVAEPEPPAAETEPLSEPEPEPEPPVADTEPPVADTEPEPEPPAPTPSTQPDPALDALVESLIAAAMHELPKVVGAAVVELERGLLLGHKARSLPADVLEQLGPLTQVMFADERLLAFDRMLEPESEPELTGVGQIILNSRQILHVFTRLEQRDDLILVVVCRDQSNLGIVLAKLAHLVRADYSMPTENR